MKLSNLMAGAVAMSLLASSVAMAEGYNPMLDDEWRVYIGAFDASVDSKITFKAVNLPELPIDVEDVLGLEDSKTVAWGGVAWHFARRHALEFETFTLNRGDSQSETYTPPLQVGDFFIEDGELSTSYDTNLARLTYAYSIVRTERSDLQFKAGLHIATLAVKVKLAGSVCGPETDPVEPPGCPAASSGDESVSKTAPLPHFGLSYTYAFTPTVGMNLGVKGFAVEIDNIDGSIIEIDADVAWQPFKHVGFGAGARYFKTEVNAKGDSLNGNIKFEYFGPAIFIHATF